MYQACALGAIVYALGRLMVKKISFLNRYCIPAPVAGGIVFALLHLALYCAGILEFTFDTTIQTILMTVFFCSVGFTACFRLLKKGGIQVFIFLILAILMCVIQDGVGLSLIHILRLLPILPEKRKREGCVLLQSFSCSVSALRQRYAGPAFHDDSWDTSLFSRILHTSLKYSGNSGVLLRLSGLRSGSENTTGRTALILPGLLVRIRILSAVLTASARSWVIKIAVFLFSLIIELISSHTASLV